MKLARTLSVLTATALVSWSASGAQDFPSKPIRLIVPIVLSAHPAVAARDAKELIALARSQPNKLAKVIKDAGIRAE